MDIKEVYKARALISNTKTKQNKTYTAFRLTIPNELVDLLELNTEDRDLVLIADKEKKEFRVLKK